MLEPKSQKSDAVISLKRPSSSQNVFNEFELQGPGGGFGFGYSASRRKYRLVPPLLHLTQRQPLQFLFLP